MRDHPVSSDDTSWAVVGAGADQPVSFGFCDVLDDAETAPKAATVMIAVALRVRNKRGDFMIGSLPVETFSTSGVHLRLCHRERLRWVKQRPGLHAAREHEE
jgi:hypothetical protein